MQSPLGVTYALVLDVVSVDCFHASHALPDRLPPEFRENAIAFIVDCCSSVNELNTVGQSDRGLSKFN